MSWEWNTNYGTAGPSSCQWSLCQQPSATAQAAARPGPGAGWPGDPCPAWWGSPALHSSHLGSAAASNRRIPLSTEPAMLGTSKLSLRSSWTRNTLRFYLNFLLLITAAFFALCGMTQISHKFFLQTNADFCHLISIFLVYRFTLKLNWNILWH